MKINFLITFVFFALNFNLFSQGNELLGLIDNKIVIINPETGETSLKFEIQNIPNDVRIRDLVYNESKEEFYTIVNPNNSPYLAKISLTGEFEKFLSFEIETGSIFMVEAISFYNNEIYFSASLNGGNNSNDFYSESLLKINSANNIEYLTEINTEKPFPDIDVLNVTENRIFIFDGAPPGQNFLEFYQLDNINFEEESFPQNVYSSSYIPIADFCLFENELLFVAEKSLYKFTNSIQKVVTLYTEGINPEENFSGLTQIPTCKLASVNLDEEIIVCDKESITLDVEYPNSTYLWSDGTTNPKKNITESGKYSVTITNPCGSITLNTEIVFGKEANIEWNDKIDLCDIDSITLNAKFPNSTYLWSDGSTNSHITVYESGIYEVEITNACGSKSYITEVSFQQSPQDFKIKAESISCDSYSLSIKDYKKDLNYIWEGYEEDSIIIAKETGWYKLKVSNKCGSKKDSIFIETKDFSNIILPNIITPNNDQKNDKFVIDERIQNASISIFNRYGKLVYQNPRYLNDWDSGNLNSGNYFYHIKLECGDIFKGWIEVKK